MSFQYQNKKRKIYDVILFNGELNVLGFRLNQLNSFVDYFIIVESEKISYELNKELFKDFEDKIIYLKIDNDPYYYQLRNFLREILPEFEDIIFISDVGEIPDLTKLDELMEPLKYDSLILGARKYGLHINKVEKLRERSKVKKKTKNYQKSWYDVLSHNPVIILGADISDMEWDIWSAFINRERNFGKKDNHLNHRFPIFQMREKNSKDCSLSKSNELWFKPLFEENLSFSEQWDKLEKLFNNEK